MMVNQGVLDMQPNLLILGGTTEATVFAKAAAAVCHNGIVSFAGRVNRIKRQPLPQRVGGFGGVSGLVHFMQTTNVTHVIDATHPFAAQMSRNAVIACAQAHVPLMALTRPPWVARTGDNWTHVPDIQGAVGALDLAACRVMLAVGRIQLQNFVPNHQHFYLLRLVDPPVIAPPFPRCHVVVSRGPFTAENDLNLMQKHRINLLVSKNAGGSGAYAKITAARRLDLPVIMIERPPILKRMETNSVTDVLTWINHIGAERGV